MKSENQFRSKMHWSLTVKIITVAVVLAFLITGYKIYLTQLSDTTLLFILFIFIVALLWCLFISPISLQADSEQVVIRMVVLKKKIPLDKIKGIERIDEKTIQLSVRTFGSGGFFGFLGKFYNRTLGAFSMYSTETHNLILIQTDQRKFVVNCNEPDQFIDFVNQKREDRSVS